jgi:hypothetical protein
MSSQLEPSLAAVGALSLNDAPKNKTFSRSGADRQAPESLSSERPTDDFRTWR